MIIAFFRTIILYIAVMACMRLMGKRQLGEMQPFELVVTIMISDFASVPMQNTGVPLINGLVPILTLSVLEIFFSFVVLKSKRARTALIGRPSILIRNGEIDMEELSRLRFSIDDLIEEVRKKDLNDISDVEIAILETDGGFSVIPKAEARTATLSDLNISGDEDELPCEIILDGRRINENMKKCGISEKRLRKMLGQMGYTDIGEIAVATYTQKDGLTVKRK